jgi:hypothetical protein
MQWSHFVSILQIVFSHVKAMNMWISGYVSITAHYASYAYTWKGWQSSILCNLGWIQFSVIDTSFLQVFPSPSSLSAHEEGVFEIIQYTWYTQKNGAVSKVNKKFISHLARAQPTPSAAATVQVSHALITNLQCVHAGSHDTHPHGNQIHPRLGVACPL